jgi:hypothetical protein
MKTIFQQIVESRDYQLSWFHFYYTPFNPKIMYPLKAVHAIIGQMNTNYLNTGQTLKSLGLWNCIPQH